MLACALAFLSPLGCSHISEVQTGPIFDLSRHPRLDGVAVDVHAMTAGDWEDHGMLWLGLGAQGKVTQRLQQIGLEGGAGATAQIGPALFYGRADPRLSFELFDATPFIVPGVGLGAGLALTLSERQGDQPPWVPGGAVCPYVHDVLRF
jgi:hypothetical protein